jgi:hypothetical protein
MTCEVVLLSVDFFKMAAVAMETAKMLIEFFQPFKSYPTLRRIILQSFMKFDERNPIFFKSPLYCFHGNCGKVCPTDSAAAAMETKKGGDLKKIWITFIKLHETL